MNNRLKCTLVYLISILALRYDCKEYDCKEVSKCGSCTAAPPVKHRRSRQPTRRAPSWSRSLACRALEERAAQRAHERGRLGRHGRVADLRARALREVCREHGRALALAPRDQRVHVGRGALHMACAGRER